MAHESCLTCLSCEATVKPTGFFLLCEAPEGTTVAAASSCSKYRNSQSAGSWMFRGQGPLICRAQCHQEAGVSLLSCALLASACLREAQDFGLYPWCSMSWACAAGITLPATSSLPEDPLLEPPLTSSWVQHMLQHLAQPLGVAHSTRAPLLC